MEQSLNEIRPGYSDHIINQKLHGPHSFLKAPSTHRFNQGEEYFIEVPDPFLVPSFPIHHDVRQPIPRTDYSNALQDFIDSMLPQVPDFFSDLSYFFDPSEIQKPCFYRIYKVGERHFLFLLRINLIYRPLESELLERGSNDYTAVYRTNRLYLESDCVPLDSVLTEMGKIVAFKIHQTISNTWIGETGQGYLVRGIWMDMELTKFFTKLFLTEGQRIYPYYPFTCKYKTVCMTILDPTSERRRQLLPYLEGVLQFLEPHLPTIQQSLKTTLFSDQMLLFKELKQKVNGSLKKPWTNIRVTPYLNSQDQKEFHIEF